MSGYKTKGINHYIDFMKYLNAYYFIALFIFGMGVNIYGQSKSNLDQKGPEWIKSELTKSHVFSAPEFVFTTEYDEFQIQDNIKGLFFEGVPYKGKQTQVFCWYGVPKSLKAGEKAPAVVLVHGGGGTAFPQWVRKWNDRGYIAISIALEGQIPGDKIKNENGKSDYQRLPSAGPSRIGFFYDLNEEPLEDQWFYHAVSDVILANSLLRSFPEVDSSNIGITGISWGGILTNVVTGIDDRYTFSIPVYGCGFLNETPLYKRLLGNLNPSAQEFYLNNWEPSLYVPRQKLPTLFVNGTNDRHFTMNSFTKTFEASTNEKYLRIEHEMRHGHGPGWEPEAIYNFADYITKTGSNPVSVVLKKISKKNQLTYKYTGGSIKKAALYYTTNAKDWDYESYKWIKVPIVLSDSKNIIKTKLPKDAQYFFINVITTDNLMYSSSMVKK